MAWRPSHPPHRTVGMPTTANESNVYADVHGILRTLPPPPPLQQARGLCNYTKNQSSMRASMEQAANHVKQQPQWPRERHFVVANDWKSKEASHYLQQLLPGVILAAMEGVDQKSQKPEDCSFGLGYTTNYAVFSPARFGFGQSSSFLQGSANDLDLREKHVQYDFEFSGTVNLRKGQYT